jgi:hypothetical protein
MPSRRRGQIIERGPRTFLVRVFIGRDARGKRQYKSVTVNDSRKRAEEALTELLRASDTHQVVPSHSLTVQEFFVDWMAHRPDLAPSTVAGQKFIWHRYLAPEIGHLKLLQVQPEHLQRTITNIVAKHGVAPATVRQHANLLKAGFGTAVARRKLAYDPSHGLLLPKVQRTERDCFSPVELRAFFAGTKDTWLGPLWLTLGTTGMRPGEVCARS